MSFTPVSDEKYTNNFLSLIISYPFYIKRPLALVFSGNSNVSLIISYLSDTSDPLIKLFDENSNVSLIISYLRPEQ